MPTAAEEDASADFFLPEFMQRFLPERKSLQLLRDNCFFSRVRRLSLEKTLALRLNMVRPRIRVGYQKVIDRFFSETEFSLLLPENRQAPNKKAAFHRARKKIPVEVCQILFAEAVEYAQSSACQQDKLTRNGFRI